MAQANSKHSTRRGFVTLAAAAATAVMSRGSEWQDVDNKTEYPERMARSLLA